MPARAPPATGNLAPVKPGRRRSRPRERGALRPRGRLTPPGGGATVRPAQTLARRPGDFGHEPFRGDPDGSDPGRRHRRRHNLPHGGGGAGPRTRAVLLHPRPPDLGRGPGEGHRLAADRPARARQSLRTRRGAHRRPLHLRRGPAAPGPALRHVLRHQHPHAGASEGLGAGDQRPVLGAQLPREDPGAGLRGPVAPHHDRPLAGRPTRFQGAARRDHPQAALRQRRRGRVPPAAVGPQPRLAA